jgi:hypothetical protein
MNKPVGVIILNWNGEKMLEKYLPTVVANNADEIADVVVADNGSTDGSLDLLAKQFPTVKVIKFDKNYGFAEGYNLAIDKTDYEYTVLLNSDVAPGAGWLTPLYGFMESNPTVGAVQPKIKADADREKFEYAGACGGYLDANGYPYCRGRIFDTVEKDEGQYDSVADLFWASGAALMVRTKLYREVGGLDKEFFAHMEEIDLCWRIRLTGYEIKVVPQSEVYHLGGGTLAAGNPRKTYLNFRNNLLMLHKNLPDDVRCRRLIIRRLYDTIAWAKYVLTFDFANAGAVLRAHNDFRKMARNYTEHPKVNLLPKSPNIIVDYFLRGKHKFSELK